MLPNPSAARQLQNQAHSIEREKVYKKIQHILCIETSTKYLNVFNHLQSKPGLTCTHLAGPLVETLFDCLAPLPRVFLDTSSTPQVVRITFALCRLLRSRFKASLGNRSEVILYRFSTVFEPRPTDLPERHSTRKIMKKTMSSSVYHTRALRDSNWMSRVPSSCSKLHLQCNLVQSGYCMLLPK